jgi:hypothetical protein
VVGFLGAHFDELRFLVQDIEEAAGAIQAIARELSSS